MSFLPSEELATSHGLARILLVEDDPGVREGVCFALTTTGYEVTSLVDGAMLASHVEYFRPDLVILDVFLPRGPDGFELAALVRRLSSAPIIFLTAAHRVEDRLHGFELDADDYITKPFSLAELLARTDVVLRRSGRLRSPSWRVRDLIVDETTRTVVRAGGVVVLSRTEFELLKALGRALGKVRTRSQLLLEIWGLEAESSNILEVTVHGLRRKLEEHGSRMIFTERGKGYILR